MDAWKLQPKRADAVFNQLGADIEGGNRDSAHKGVLKVLELEKSSSSLQKSSWYHSAAIIVGEIMGTGVMGLPAATAKLGWVVGLGSIIVFGLCSNYSALLLADLRNRHYSQAHSYSDLALEIVGPRFSKFTRAAIITNW